jgi:hypothetical protein
MISSSRKASVEASDRHPFLRPGRLNTYTAYSVGCAVAWAVLWGIVLATARKETLGYFLVAFIGWLVGWTSATIAGAVYPPPKKGHAASRTSGSGIEFVRSFLAHARRRATARVCLLQRLRLEHRAARWVRATFGALLRREPRSNWGWG